MSRLEMDATTLARLSKLLDEALEQVPAARGEWVDTLGQEFDALKPQLRDLLSRAASVETGEFLGTIPKIDPGASDVAPAPRGQPGEIVGPYRLVRELGVGGMGSVWLAERADGLIQRSIALKLPHVVTPRRAELAERMAREREILAALDHPNIAKLFDAGLSAAGQPYLALEYVEGIPIDRFCQTGADGGPLTLAARLRLFQQVANAVAYAHGKLVVHRDLKPANILVTPSGGVRLLDFGIAKLLDDGEAKATQLTQFSGGAFTPDYASPEQILGEPLTVASDVYSLGVVLYELLTGARPYKLKRDSRGALEDAIVQAEPARPSEAAPAVLRKALRGDLDTIVLKALKKNPQERYATVNAIADDVARHLEDRPVLARPDRVGYRLRKFIVRNKFGVGAVALIVTAILAGAGVAVWQARVAIAERQRAEQVKDFVSSIFRNADPWFGPQESPSAAAVLARARQSIDADFAATGAVRIELLNLLGESLLHLQDRSGAREVVKVAVAEGEQVLGATHPQTLRAHALMSDILRGEGRTDEAYAENARVLPVLLAPGAQPSVAAVSAIAQHGTLLNDKGDYAGAVAEHLHALAVLGRVNGDQRALRLTVLQLLADGQEAAGDYPAALDSSKRAYQLARELYEKRGGHPDLITTRKIYARQLAQHGDLRQAIDLFTQSIDEARHALGPDSDFVVEIEQNAIQWLVVTGELARAREYAAHALPIIEKSAAPDSPYLGAMYDVYAFVNMSSRRPAEALPAYDRTLALTRAAVGPTNPFVYTQRMNRALALAYLGKGAEALSELKTVADEYPKLPGAWSIFVPARSLGEAHRLMGHYSEAVSLQRRSLQMIGADEPALARHRSRGLTELGLALNGIGKFAEALAAFDTALPLYDQTLFAPTPYRTDALIGRGRARLELGQAAGAHTDLAAADAFWRGFDAQNRNAGEAAYWLGRAQSVLGRTAEARANLARAERILRSSALAIDQQLAAQARAAG